MVGDLYRADYGCTHGACSCIALQCVGRDVDLAFRYEESMVGAQYVRYLSVSVALGVLVSAVVLIAFGTTWSTPRFVVPLWISGMAVAGLLWLCADRMRPRLTPDCTAEGPDDECFCECCVQVAEWSA